jgi:hypothetical protein
VVVIAAIAVTTLLAWIGPVYDWSQRNAEAFFREPPAVWRETNCPACVVIGCEAQRLESIDPGYHLAPVQPGFIPLEGSK